MMRALVALAAAWCAACSLPRLRQPQQSAPFDPAPCAFEVPAKASVRCGWLTVPENRERPNTRDIRLHVAIYASPAAVPQPDPIVWLVGGPGGRAHFLSSRLYDRVIAPYLWNRDFVVLDVRGTGFSRPSLDCPDRSGDPGIWLAACRERLAATADLHAYHSAAVAADLADLRQALGVREWNLFGESYGTRLALAAARDAPAGIRSIVLDSVVALEADQYADGPSKFDAAVAALCRNCAADRVCNAAFPDLRAALLADADRLDAAPRRIQGDHQGIPYDFRLDGRTLMQALHMALYESDLIPRLPRAIYGADNAALGQALAIGSIIDRALVDFGAHYSFHCAEEVAFTDQERMRTENARRPWMRGVVFAPHVVDACRFWRARDADPREALPVESPIPVLLLSGEYDPVTPPAYAASAASHLPNSYNIVFPGLGHWVTANPVSTCAQTLVRAFIDNPRSRPPDDCVRRYRPQWATR
jgi:pimeloyl-ACP methyl ester carboxylesterase